MDDYDVAIVGGGLAGLIAGCETAGAGLKTVLFESAAELGGRARTRRQDGFHFNQGPHAVYAAGALRRALDDLGVGYKGAPAPIAGGQLLWGETLHPLPGGAASLLTATPLGVRDRLELATTLGKLSQGKIAGEGRSLSEVTRAFRPRVRRVIETLARLSTYANAPDTLDAQAALDQIRLAFANVLYLDGGWETLIAGLARTARGRGAEIAAGLAVTALAPHETGWRVTLADGRALSARAVILAADPATCASLAPDVPDIAAAAGRVAPVRAVCLDLALSALPAPGNGFALGVDEPLYLSVHSKTARLAPDGGALIHLAWYLAPAEAPTKAHLERLERLADQLQPGWRGLEVARQQLLGIAVAHDYPRPGRARAVISPSAPAPLYLAGDWVGEAGLLSDASAASARLAASSAIARLNACA